MAHRWSFASDQFGEVRSLTRINLGELVDEVWVSSFRSVEAARP